MDVKPALLAALVLAAPAHGAGFVALHGDRGMLTVGRTALADVVVAGPRLALVTAQSSAAVWVAHRDAAGLLRLRGCVHPPFQRACDPAHVSDISYLAPVAVAGHDVYVADARHGVLVRYRRSGERLRYAGCLADAPRAGCGSTGAAKVRGAQAVVVLRRARALAFSTANGRIALFARAASGPLSPAACLSGPRSKTCTAGVIAQAPGFYIAGNGSWAFTSAGDSISSFEPGAQAPVKGVCVTDAGSFFSETDSLPGCTHDAHATGDSDFGMPLFATPRFVYASDFTIGSIGMGIGWWRRGTGGALTFAGCLDEGTGASDGGCAPGRAAASDPALFAADRTNRTLVVWAGATQGLALLRIDPRTGTPRAVPGLRGCITEAGDSGNPVNRVPGEHPRRTCLADPRVLGIEALAVTRPGDLVYATSGRRLLAYGVR